MGIIAKHERVVNPGDLHNESLKLNAVVSRFVKVLV